MAHHAYIDFSQCDVEFNVSLYKLTDGGYNPIRGDELPARVRTSHGVKPHP
jgi:hypothetical protein